MLTSLERIRQLPTRNRIRTSRLRTTGFFAQTKRKIFDCCPWCFDVDEGCKFFNRQILRPFCAKLGLYQYLCECRPLKAGLKQIGKLWDRLCKFRWLCDWCPPFMLRLRKEVTTEEDEADFEKAEQDAREEENATQET